MTLLLVLVVVLLALVAVAGVLWRRSRARRERPAEGYVETTFIGW